MPSCRRPLLRPGSSIGGVNAIGIHHVGVAVSDLDEAVGTYTSVLGGTLEHRDLVPDQGVEAASVLVGASRIELLSPLGDDTPVGRFLANRGPGVHHIAYEVEDAGVALAALAAAGVELIDPAPRLGLFGLQVAFVHPDAVHGVLTEVVSLAREL
jgi:methylmalonyl-CoA epimerase